MSIRVDLSCVLATFKVLLKSRARRLSFLWMLAGFDLMLERWCALICQFGTLSFALINGCCDCLQVWLARFHLR